MATKHFINKLVAGGGAGNGLIKSKRLMAVLGILGLWLFCGVASIPAAQAQNAANLAIDSPGATVDSNVVNFHTTSGLNDADWRYWWVVRGPRNQWTFAGPSGNLDLPPGDYRATVTARDRYGDTAYQDTSTFRVESPTATSTAGRRPAGNPNYQNDGRTYGGRTYNDGSYDRYGNRDNGYNDRYRNGYPDDENYYPDSERYDDGYGDNRYGNPYGDNQYDGAYDRTYGDRYGNVPYGDGYDEEYGGNFDGGYGGYDKVRCGAAYNGYGGGYYGTGYDSEYNGGEEYQNGGGYGGGSYGDEDLGNYGNGEDNYNY